MRSAIQKFSLSSNNYAEVFRNQMMIIQYKHDILNLIIMKIIMVMMLRSRLSRAGHWQWKNLVASFTDNQQLTINNGELTTKNQQQPPPTVMIYSQCLTTHTWRPTTNHYYQQIQLTIKTNRQPTTAGDTKHKKMKETMQLGIKKSSPGPPPHNPPLDRRSTVKV